MSSSATDSSDNSAAAAASSSTAVPVTRSFVAPSYLSAEELHALLVDPETAAKTLVVDVRDEDHHGGHIAGALNIPSEEFAQSMSKVQTAAKDKDRVVFHCMQSQQRGPKAARMMAETIAKHGPDGFAKIQILENGFSGWARYLSRMDESTRVKVKHQLVSDYLQQQHGYKI